MLDRTVASSPLHPIHDPALLAFIKCHVTSLAKWHALRALGEQPDRWLDTVSLSRHCSGGHGLVRALADLAREGVVEQMSGSGGQALYRLNSDDPTTNVVCRLVSTLSHNHELRQIVVAHVLQTAGVP